MSRNNQYQNGKELLVYRRDSCITKVLLDFLGLNPIEANAFPIIHVGSHDRIIRQSGYSCIFRPNNVGTRWFFVRISSQLDHA